MRFIALAVSGLVSLFFAPATLPATEPSELRFQTLRPIVTRVRELPRSETKFWSLAISSDAKHVFYLMDSRLQHFDLKLNVRKQVGEKSSGLYFAVSGDGQSVVIALTEALEIWDFKRSRLTQTIKLMGPNPVPIHITSWADGDNSIIGLPYRSVPILVSIDNQTAEHLRSPDELKADLIAPWPYRDLTVGGDKKDVAAGITPSGHIVLWNLVTFEPKSLIRNVHKDYWPNFISLRKDAKEIIVCRLRQKDILISVVDVSSERILHSRFLKGGFSELAASTCGRFLLLGSRDGAITIAPLQDDAAPSRIQAHNAQVKSLSFSSSNTFVSGDVEGNITLWRLEEPASKPR